MILGLDPGLRHLGAAVTTLEGDLVDAWLPRSTAKARIQAGERIPAPDGPLAWIGMVGAVLDDLEARGHLRNITVLALEWPEIYREKKLGKLKKSNPNDLLELAAVEGGIVWGLPRLQRYERFTPRQWKKNYRKDSYQDAIVHALRPPERVILEQTPESLRHNVIESIGIARFMATVLAGHPTSAPVFQRIVAKQGRAPQATLSLDTQSQPPMRRSARAPAAAPQVPAYRTALPPSSRAGTPSYGSRHREEFAQATQRRTARAAPASYPPRKP